ncbi:hypothetical protein GpartN1_g464.t1 [Galdieria partita]|uniref:Generative cell specific-1/HAP2 domain-containing protein n=1 Tax=Galdieria partita TaxID=83374 RepID=A0A9C7PQ80_9RHOD|nr:hypothetical protein GpartN1_g464.t1 [Galdieria partita]
MKHTKPGTIFYIIVCVLSFYSPASRATLTSAGEIQSCTNNGSSSLHCDKKWVVTFAIANGQQGVDSTVAKVFGSNQSEPLTDPSDPNKAYLFNYTLHITLSKSKIAIEYPLVYLQDFNNQPYEIVYEANSNGPLEEYTNPCVDSWGSSNPTCGYAYNPPNEIDIANRIYNSQGFCCQCGVSDYLAEGTREGLSCNLLGSLFQIEPSQAAHCLRFDPLWYSGFKVGTYELYYWVTVNISRCPLNTTVVNNSICSLETFEVGPTSPLAYSDKYGIQIQDIGDFSPWQGTPTYSNKLLMKPDYCQDSQWWCLNRTADIPSEIAKWMLVDTDQVTLSGDECNKVGVSYSAFQDESSRCLRAVNSCLGNQLEDFYKSDLKALKEGTSGNYFVQFFGDFDGNDVSGANPKMRFWTDRIQSSNILLEFAAASLFHVVDVSEGKIVDAKVNLVEAYSKDGKMTITIQNTGKVEAAYEVTASCPNNILPILAQQVYIQPNQTKNITFQVDVEDTHGGNFICNISLQNSIGQSISSYKVRIDSAGINVSTGPQAGQPSGSDGTTSSNYGSSSACQKSCGSFFNIICFFEHSCWLNILYVILVVIGLLVGGCIGIKLFMHFGLSFLMNLFKMPQRSSRTGRNHRNHEQNDSSTSSSYHTTPYVAPPPAVYYVPRKHHHHLKRRYIVDTPYAYRYDTEPIATYIESASDKITQPVRRQNYKKYKSRQS